jgi:hypothetical protein
MKGMPTTMGEMMHALEYIGGMSTLQFKADTFEVEPVPETVVESD